MKNESDSERIKILRNKYLPKNNQISQMSTILNTCGMTSSDDVERKRLRDYKSELNRSLTEQLQSDEDEVDVFYTETDVTLPSVLIRSYSPDESIVSRRDDDDDDDDDDDVIDQNRRRRRRSAAAATTTVHVYQEMMNIYEKLQAERVSQQVWCVDLCERERELQKRENQLLQHQHHIQKLKRSEDHTMKDIQSLQQRYQQETDELKETVKRKTKEIKRMKSSFDSMKELNDSLKKQLDEVSEQNRKLEIQSRKVQSRLENLQRRNEYSKTHAGPEHHKVYESKPIKQENPSSKKTNKEIDGPVVKVLSVLLDWVVDEDLINPRDQTSNITTCQSYVTSRPSLHQRCSTILPMLVELLHHHHHRESSVMESSLQLSLLRCIYCSLTQLQHNTQYVPLTSTLRRLCDEMFDKRFFKSSCIHTRLLSSLIIIKTCSQVDLLAQSLDVLSGVVRSDEGQHLFLHYGALSSVLSVLRGSNRALLMLAVDILLQMSTQSRFLEECSSEDFFRSVSSFFRNPGLDVVLLEKMSVLLQKLSSIGKNKRLFEGVSLHLLLQEIRRTADPSKTFLNINISSILLHLNRLKHT